MYYNVLRSRSLSERLIVKFLIIYNNLSLKIFKTVEMKCFDNEDALLFTTVTFIEE